jgi:RNA polymerase sigma-70 factor (ECF subfamily)
MAEDPTKNPDKQMVERCLAHQPGAWNDFVDRYLSLIYRIIQHTAHHRNVTLRPEDVEDLASEVLLQLVANNYASLRQFQGRSSLATYLTVIGRRACIHLLARKFGENAIFKSLPPGVVPEPAHTEENLPESVEHVHNMLTRLPKQAREVVRLYYLEGRTYEDISAQLGIPVNSIGPLLSRSRQLLRTKLQGQVSSNGLVGTESSKYGVA